MKKKLSIISAMTVTIFILSSCGSGIESALTLHMEEINTVHEESASWNDIHTELDNCYENVALAGGKIYGYYTSETGVTVCTYNISAKEAVSEVSLPGVESATAIAADADGNIYVLGDEVLWKISTDKSVSVFDDYELEDQYSRIEPQLKGMYTDEEGRFYIHCSLGVPSSIVYEDGEDNVYSETDRIYIKDSRLNTLFYVQVPYSRGNQLLSFSFSDDGTPMILAKTEEYTYIAEIDLEAGKLVEKARFEGADFTGTSHVTFTEDGFIYCKGNDLYEYDYVTAAKSRIFSLSSMGILADHIIHMEINDGSIEIVDNYSSDYPSEYVAISEGENERTLVTLGVTMTTNELESAVTAYNRFSEDTRVEIIEYYTGDDFETSLDELKLDIIRGEGPDIINLSGINTDSYAEKGLFADLYGFMENDSEINKESFLPAVLNSFETGEHLYSMGASFQVHTVWGAKAFTGGKSGVNIEEFISLLNSRGKSAGAVSGLSGDEPVLTTLCTFAFSEFIDYEDMTCDFDTEQFKGLLDFASDWEYTYEGTIPQAIADGEILLTVGTISSIADYQLQDELYGGVSFIGYPTTESNGTALSYRGSELAISTRSSVQKEAWDFLKYYMINGYDGTGFPVLTEKFDAEMERAMTDDVFDSMEGTYTGPKLSFRVSDTDYILIYAADEADVAAVRTLIDTADVRYKYNTDVMNIITEEAESYMSGQKSFEEVADIIDSRVSIWLAE